jgi:hypothetical protein
MKNVNKGFLQKLDKGGRIFKFKKDGEGDDYILYTVEKKTSVNNFELMNAFDEKEKIKKISSAEIIKEGCWFFNPSF